MTKDREAAEREAQALANQTNVAYLYRLRDGYYYVSAAPPGSFSAEFVLSKAAQSGTRNSTGEC